MERTRTEPTLMDNYISELGDPKLMSKLSKLSEVVPWEKLAEPIKATYKNNSSKGGRSNIPVVMMLKIVMLQKWFNLSDPAMEGMLLDRISFRKFVGLSLTEGTVDETTIVQFRKRLQDHGLIQQLFDAVVKHLTDKGVIVKEGTLVDATIIEAPKGKKREDGSSTKQKSASYTKKHGRKYHGHKAHIATDRKGMIKDYVYGTAKEHDSKHIDQLIEGEEKAVYADSAYMDKQRKKRLEDKGIFCGIIERRVRGQDDLTEQQKEHNKYSASFRAYVEHPFAWMKRFGGLGKTRYRGLYRNAQDFALQAIAYNFHRSLSIKT